VFLNCISVDGWHCWGWRGADASQE